jgi:hypothetical protein
MFLHESLHKINSVLFEIFDNHADQATRNAIRGLLDVI